MARLRHFAVCVGDLDKAAKFYGDVFGLKRHGSEDLPIGSAVFALPDCMAFLGR